MKKGITVTMMTVVVIVMIILATTITVTINSSIKYSRLSVWANEIGTIQDVAYETALKKSAVDFLLDEVDFNISGISQDILNEQFKGETITNNTITFNEIDLGKLEIANTVYGNKEDETDIYVYSTTTQKVYYIAGIQDKYYTLTEELSNRFNIQSVDTKSSVISFVPSIQGFTNKPISVVVKVPSEFSNVNVTTSVTGMTVANTGTVDNRACYKVNSENLTGNYNITVSYNNGQETLAATYMVNGYDTTKPVIEDITENNLSYKQNETVKKASLENIKVSDTESGVDKVWYIKGNIPTNTQDVLEYFKLNGTKIRKNKFNIEYLNGTYTICAVDRAGNYTYGVCEIDNGGWIQTSNRTVVKGDTVVKIGDYINYDATNGGTITGLTDTRWQVLGAENGELLIMSSSDVTKKTFGEKSNLEVGKKTYLNAISELNKICEPYGKGAYATGARSITIEDIDKVTGYDKTTYEYTAESYKIKYNDTVTYYWDNSTLSYPYYEISNNNIGNLIATHDVFVYYDGQKWISSTPSANLSKKEKICTLLQTYYKYDADVDTTLNRNTELEIYKMLFGEQNNNHYWIASTYQNLHQWNATFGIRMAINGTVDGKVLVYSNAGVNTYGCGVRSVVSLSQDVNLTGSSKNGWNIVADRWIQRSNRTVVKGDTVLKIGDTVTYDATNGGTITGLINTSWEVLGAENGELLIMSVENIETKRFNIKATLEEGIMACETGISYLNSICIPYGKGEYATGARSVRAEDIDKVTGYDKTTYGKGTEYQYGNVLTYSYNGTSTPKYSYINEEGIEVSGTLKTLHSKGFGWIDSQNVYHNVSVNDLISTNNKGKEIAKLTSTIYKYDVDKETSLEKGADAYRMLFGGSDDNNYWLASLTTNTWSQYIVFGLRYVRNGKIDFQGQVFSSGTSNSDDAHGVRAVVSISRYAKLSPVTEYYWNITGLDKMNTTNKIKWTVLI